MVGGRERDMHSSARCARFCSATLVYVCYQSALCAREMLCLYTANLHAHAYTLLCLRFAVELRRNVCLLRRSALKEHLATHDHSGDESCNAAQRPFREGALARKKRWRWRKEACRSAHLPAHTAVELSLRGGQRSVHIDLARRHGRSTAHNDSAHRKCKRVSLMIARCEPETDVLC